MAFQHFPLLILVLFGGCFALPMGKEGSEAPAASVESSQLNRTVPEMLLEAVDISGLKYRLGGNGLLVNFFRASEICQINGWELVKINSLADNNLLVQALAINGYKDSVWTSGNRLGDDATWRFLNGQPVHYFNWLVGEPNNAGGNEKCIEVYSYGKWNDVPCIERRNFLCQPKLGASVGQANADPEQL